MQINKTEFSNKIPYCNSIRKQSYPANTLPKDSLSFTGHALSEKYGRRFLHHQTSFFREIGTLKTLVEYLKTHFQGTPLEILVGACSTGEEARSIQMLFETQKPNITAFDIGKKAIKMAKSGKSSISRFLNRLVEQQDNDVGFNTFADSFLAFDRKDLTKEEQYLKNLFNENFQFLNEKTDKFTLGMGFRRYILKLLGKVNSFFAGMEKYTDKREIHKHFQYKNNDEINFLVGDIMNISEFAGDKKYHAITFRNALYHMVTDDYGMYRLPKNEKIQKEVFEKIATQLDEHLVPNGIFVIGEHEETQITNVTLLDEILKKHHFVEYTDSNGTVHKNIWEKSQ